MNASPSKQAAKTAPNKTQAAALAHARKLSKEYGPCTVVREVAQKYKSLSRGEVLEIAAALKINKGTASRQFQEIRSGNIKVEG